MILFHKHQTLCFLLYKYLTISVWLLISWDGGWGICLNFMNYRVFMNKLQLLKASCLTGVHETFWFGGFSAHKADLMHVMRRQFLLENPQQGDHVMRESPSFFPHRHRKHVHAVRCFTATPHTPLCLLSDSAARCINIWVSGRDVRALPPPPCPAVICL